MGTRLYIMPAGAEILRLGDAPLYADADGIGEGVEVKGITNLKFTESE